MRTKRGENKNGAMVSMVRAAIQAGDGICEERDRPFPNGMMRRAFELL